MTPPAMNYNRLLISVFAFGLILSSFVVESDRVTDENATAEEVATDEIKEETTSEFFETTKEEITTGKEGFETTERSDVTTEKVEATTGSEEESTTEGQEEATSNSEEESTTEGQEEVTSSSEEESTAESQEKTTERDVEITTPDEVKDLKGKCECLAGISGTIFIGSSLKEIHLNDDQLSVKCDSNAAESCKKLCLAKIKKRNKGLKLKRKTGKVMCAFLKLSFKKKVEIWSKITCDSPKYSFAVTTTTNTGYSFKGKLSCKDGNLAIKSSEENTDETDETDEADETDEDDD